MPQFLLVGDKDTRGWAASQWSQHKLKRDAHAHGEDLPESRSSQISPALRGLTGEPAQFLSQVIPLQDLGHLRN